MICTPKWATNQKQDILQSRSEIQHVTLTDRDGLDMAYESNTDIAIIGMLRSLIDGQ